MPRALQQWREAERVAAVARRGRLAAETAADSAAEAASAAQQTAEAARRALEAATLAEESAARTARAAQLAAGATMADSQDAVAEVALAEHGEQIAHQAFTEAVDREMRHVTEEGR